MTITRGSAMTVRLAAAAGIMLVIAGVMSMAYEVQPNEMVKNTAYLFFVASVGLAASAVCACSRSRITPCVAVAAFLTVALTPVVEFILTHPVEIIF